MAPRAGSKERGSTRSLKIEKLEKRELLSVTLSDGVLRIEGTPGADTATVDSYTDQGDPWISATLNASTTNYEASPIWKVVFIGYDGDDHFRNSSGLASHAWGNGGNDTLIGGSSQDHLYGGSNADNIYGGAGNDSLYGHSGADRIYGEHGNDVIVGSNGNDYLSGGDGNDRIYGGYDNDTLYGGTGRDTLFGSAGDNQLYGGAGSDGLYGGRENDFLYGGGGNDRVYGYDGNDRLYGGYDNDTLYGGTGRDTLFGSAGDNKLYGGAGSDGLYGGRENDLLYGGEGNDRVYGYGGNDTISGASGSDRLDGGDGNDCIYGGYDNDTLYGGTGRDSLFGTSGDNRLYGGSGADRLYGGHENDSVYGEDGADVIRGYGGADTIWGGSGIDRLFGGDGNDNLYGGAHSDYLYGEDGDDGLFGGVSSRDYLVGGFGSDRFLTQTNDSVSDLQYSDARLLFVNGTSPYTSRAKNWSNYDVERVDPGLAQLHHTAHSARVLRDTYTNLPVKMYIAYAFNGRYIGFNWFTGWERQIHILSGLSAETFSAVVVHEFGHNWDSSGEGNQYWSYFNQLHRQSTRSNDFTRSYGQTNAKEDWATNWEVYFGYFLWAAPSNPSSLLLQKQATVDSFFANFNG